MLGPLPKLYRVVVSVAALLVFVVGDRSHDVVPLPDLVVLIAAGCSPQEGERLYDLFVQQARAAWPEVATGKFGADMQVHLVNDGPVTIPLTVR